MTGIRAALRTVKDVHSAVQDDIADLKTRRPLPSHRLSQIDPFLFLNHHGPQVYPPRNQGLPFGPHPHRGFETVTFILDGDIAHRDSGGHESIIEAGGIQWMTAGSGLVHEEVSSEKFKESGGALEILQLWVNLPARLKMTKPGYVGLQRADIPSFSVAEQSGVDPVGGESPRAEIQLISGSVNGVRGPVESLADISLMVLKLDARAVTHLETPRERNIFFYVVKGSVQLGDREVNKFNLVEFNHDGDRVRIEAHSDAVILLGHAKPFGEPVVAHGPFVMNTREEIVQAIHVYQAGLFGSASLGSD